MWCKDITECLITEGDRLEAMKGAEQMCVQVCQAFITIILLCLVLRVLVISDWKKGRKGEWENVKEVKEEINICLVIFFPSDCVTLYK